MIPESDATRLIERLERHSRRSRPFLIYGLVAIIAGFLLLTWRINGLREDAEQRRAEAEKKAGELLVRKTELRNRIDQAGQLAAAPHQPSEAPEVLRRIRTILGEASETTEKLAAAEAPVPTVAAAAHQPDEVAPAQDAATKAAPLPKAESGTVAQIPRPTAIRIFLHIAEQGQYSGAKELQWSLRGSSLDGTKIVVPGIEMVDQADDTLRCLKRQDCQRAEEVAALVNSKLRGRSLRIVNLSSRYEGRSNVRPGTYEVWLGGGPVLVSAE